MPKIPIGNPAKNVHSAFIFCVHKKANDLFNCPSRQQDEKGEGALKTNLQAVLTISSRKALRRACF
jgi:hypothetical protein